MKNSNMPTSPVSSDVITLLGPDSETQMTGLTKREAFAMAAMQGLLSSTNFPTSINGVDVCEYQLCAKASIKQADALLAELEKE